MYIYIYMLYMSTYNIFNIRLFHYTARDEDVNSSLICLRPVSLTLPGCVGVGLQAEADVCIAVIWTIAALH